MQSLIAGYDTAKSGSIFGREEEKEDLISLSQGDDIDFKQFTIGEIFDFHIPQKPNHVMQKAKKVPSISATMKDNGVYDVVDADNVYKCEQLFCITVFGFISYQGFHEFLIHGHDTFLARLHDGLIEKENDKTKQALALLISSQLIGTFNFFFNWNKRYENDIIVSLPVNKETQKIDLSNLIDNLNL